MIPHETRATGPGPGALLWPRHKTLLCALAPTMLSSSLTTLLATARSAHFQIGSFNISLPDALALCGCVVVGAVLLLAALSVLRILRSTIVPNRRLTSYGKWAVITGATDVRGAPGRLACVRYAWCASVRAQISLSAAVSPTPAQPRAVR